MLTYKQIKKQIPADGQIQVGDGQEAEFATAAEFSKLCFKRKQYDYEPEEIRIYQDGKTTEFAIPQDGDDDNAADEPENELESDV